MVIPPEGTQPNTDHILSAEGHMVTDPRVEFRATWNGEMWHWKGCHPISPRKAEKCGFEYVRKLD